MVRVITSLLLICMATGVYAQTSAKESVARAYYTGFEKKDWKTVEAQFAKGFTFTSPNNDDHIHIEKFKEKCWATAKFVKKARFIKVLEKGDDLMLLVRITTSDGKVIRNVDVFNFNNKGKIKSIEVFFGTGSKFPGNADK
jgi:hypothetical protein